MTLADHLQAIAEGRGTPADVDAALRLHAEGAPLHEVRSDWLAEAPRQIESSELAGYRPAHRLRALIHQEAGDAQLAMLAFIMAAGDPPEAELVHEALALVAVGGSPESEERFFLAHAASLEQPLARASFLAHVAAAHHDVGLDDAAAAWMERAVEAAPGEARVPALQAYFREHRLGYALGLVR